MSIRTQLKRLERLERQIEAIEPPQRNETSMGEAIVELCRRPRTDDAVEAKARAIAGEIVRIIMEKEDPQRPQYPSLTVEALAGRYGIDLVAQARNDVHAGVIRRALGIGDAVQESSQSSRRIDLMCGGTDRICVLPMERLVTLGGDTVSGQIIAVEIAIGYVRVSTEEQAREGVSLDAQRAKIAAYCALHGQRLERTYADEGISGKRADNRPALQEAITRACQANGVLVVYSLSRLARSTRDAIEIAERLDRSGANLVSITERIDTTTSMGKFFFTTIAALAQLERDQISERTCMALAHMRRANQRTSGIVPYGFRLDADGSTLAEDSAEQRTLVLIRHMHKRGLSTRRIGRQLIQLGHHPRSGTHWHPKVVMDLARRAAG